MAPSQSTVEVRVQEGVLWVNGEAYPLRNISHVGQRMLEVDKGAAWRKFIARALITLVIGGIVAAAVGEVGVILLVAVLGLLIWRLVALIGKPPLYGLVLNTSGTQRDAVWSTEHSEIQALVMEITKAIGRPDTAQVVYNVRHAVMGDHIEQYGAGSIGKAQHSGSGNIGTR
ncbi:MULTISPECIES: DUF6232 family protein [unclassified Streptomyces]|uniref:DUF6232 family protein n=1 Tax=unclassified Streptomyces TaxID=2593676 RepID=UPI00214AE5ED|nr:MULTISPECIES: DUF6232 family protein [unclassified Streptomyces]MCX5012470.1 DUF6232 family protein [Streptomyces sp. NBC_00555]MCX5606435.1 DUF6232 family protein [Streptomyces sp. NBC_00047]UUU40678.1 DUF6232 family protein [Streptomyces sp. NBC_00162]